MTKNKSLLAISILASILFIGGFGMNNAYASHCDPRIGPDPEPGVIPAHVHTGSGQFHGVTTNQPITVTHSNPPTNPGDNGPTTGIDGTPIIVHPEFNFPFNPVCTFGNTP